MIHFIFKLLLVSPFFLILIYNFFSTEKFKIIILNFSFLLTFFIYFFYLSIDYSLPDYHYFESLQIVNNSFLNFKLEICIDNISLLFLLLTVSLFPLCLLASWHSVKHGAKLYFYLFFVLELLIILIFVVNDLLFFYIFFESVLIPMFIIIGVWGSRSRKVHAAYQFFFYTLVGSLFMLLSIISLYYTLGTLNFDLLVFNKLSPSFQILIWTAFGLAFAVKIPMIPFHIWLPEAHVEAPTAGSMVLAGILLKLGTYGFLKLLIPICLESSLYLSPVICLLSFLGIIYASLTTIRQIDLKKIIAYSSVVHMSYVTLGLFAFTTESILGAIFLMISHGVVSSALFYMIGILYDRYGTKLIYYYGGLALCMPLFTLFFFLFILGNISLPGSVSFIGEILVLVGIFQYSPILCFIAGMGTLFGATYNIWLYNRIAYLTKPKFKFYLDLTRLEFYILSVFIYYFILLGIYPKPLLNLLDYNIIIKYLVL